MSEKSPDEITERNQTDLREFSSRLSASELIETVRLMSKEKYGDIFEGHGPGELLTAVSDSDPAKAMEVLQLGVGDVDEQVRLQTVRCLLIDCAERDFDATLKAFSEVFSDKKNVRGTALQEVRVYRHKFTPSQLVKVLTIAERHWDE